MCIGTDFEPWDVLHLFKDALSQCGEFYLELEQSVCENAKNQIEMENKI